MTATMKPPAKSPSPQAAQQTAKPAVPAPRQPLTRPGQPGLSIARPTGMCAVTNQPIPPGSKFHAALRETLTGIERIDVLADQWANVSHEELLAHWTAVMPEPGEKPKKLLVDDEVLLSVFQRLSESDDDSKLAFRFVLGLILMRKRLLVYEGAKKNKAGTDLWQVRLRGKEDILDLVDPRLSGEQIADLAGQLSEIVAGEESA